MSYQFHGKTPGKKNKSRKALNYAKSMAARGVHCFCLLNNGRRSNGYFAVVAGYINWNMDFKAVINNINSGNEDKIREGESRDWRSER